MSVRADAETLRQIPIFAECDTVHLQLLAFASERQHFVTGDTIIRQGEKAKSAFLILNGNGEILQATTSGQQFIARADPGTFLGEVAMIGKTAYSVSVLAASPVSTARIDHLLFLRVANEYPEFGQTVFNAMARRLDNAMRDFDSVRNHFTRAKSFLDI